MTVMKIKDLLPALKPGFILAAINVLLCGLFAIGGALAIGVSAALVEYWNLPAPLMPIIVMGAIPVSVIAWIVFSARVRQPRMIRIAVAAIGTAPLVAVSGLAITGALWFITLPSTPSASVVGSIMIALIASAAIAVCAGCVIWVPGLGATPEARTS
jgi:hypothetical protein